MSHLRPSWPAVVAVLALVGVVGLRCTPTHQTIDVQASPVDAAPTDATDSGPVAMPDACAPRFVDNCGAPPAEPNCTAGWCVIRSGCFVMGSPPCEWGRAKYTEDETPTTLTHDFLMKQTEVTQAEWSAEGLPNPSGTLGSGREHDCLAPDCPVGKVNWYEALAYSNRLSVRAGLPECYALSGCTGELGAGLRCASATSTNPSLYDCKGIRIPTEAEWEYAARSGTRTAFYSGEISPGPVLGDCYPDSVLEKAGWYCANTDGGTNPVAQKPPNPWGIFDIAGNASEYVSDGYDGHGYGGVARSDPGASLVTGELMYARGGTAWGPPNLARSANRMEVSRTASAPAYGIRLVRRAD